MQGDPTAANRSVAVDAAALHAEILALRGQVGTAGRSMWRDWRPRIRRRSFATSALNFAHYLALRQHDLRPLQRRLMPLGLSSLGRAEGRVLVTLDAVASSLALLAGRTGAPRWPSGRQFFRGEERLAAATAALFGPPPPGRNGRILVTLGSDAADDPGVLGDMVGRGADAVRINCAHDDAAAWARMIGHLRAAEAKAGRRIPLLMDIAGPKVRIGAILAPPERMRLEPGDELLLRPHQCLPHPDYPVQATCTLAAVFDRLGPGDVVSIDDGKARGRVVGRAHGGVVLRIEAARLKGLKLKPEKGLNFPTLELDLDPLTAKDLEDIAFVAAHADMVGYSFVEKPEHVAALQEALARHRLDWYRLGLVAKIETPRAIRNLPEIVVAAAGRQPLAVMIARGDLAVEIGFERLAEMQEEILWLCEAAHVPAIWATQVLEGLVSKGQPSRGEMTDAAMSARAEVVMLNKGPNVGAGIDVLDRVLRRMSAHQVKKTPILRALHSWPRPEA